MENSNPLTRPMHPIWMLGPLAILLPPIGLIAGVVYLFKPTIGERISGMIGIAISIAVSLLALLGLTVHHVI